LQLKKKKKKKNLEDLFAHSAQWKQKHYEVVDVLTSFRKM